MQGVQVRPLVGELRSHMPGDAAKIKKKKRMIDGNSDLVTDVLRSLIR